MGNCESNNVLPIVPLDLRESAVEVCFIPGALRATFIDSELTERYMTRAMSDILPPVIDAIIASYIQRNVSCWARGCYTVTDNQASCKRCKRTYCNMHLLAKQCDRHSGCDECSPLRMYVCTKHGIDCPGWRPHTAEERSLLEQWQAFDRCPCKCESSKIERERLVKTLQTMSDERNHREVEAYLQQYAANL